VKTRGVLRLLAVSRQPRASVRIARASVLSVRN